MTEAAMAAAITVSIAGVSYAVLNTDATTRQAEKVASVATCRAVNTAIVAYTAENGTAPTATSQLAAYVSGDIAKYRIARGRAVGPGC